MEILISELIFYIKFEKISKVYALILGKNTKDSTLTVQLVMKGFFVNGVRKQGQGLTDFGYYTEERGSPRTVAGYEELVSEDKAYIVEVFETDKFGLHIRLKSKNRRIAAETKGKLKMKNRGLNNSLYQTTEEPMMPEEYTDPHKAVEMYAEYTLEHGRAHGIEMENIDWESLLEEDKY